MTFHLFGGAALYETVNVLIHIRLKTKSKARIHNTLLIVKVLSSCEEFIEYFNKI